MPHIQPLDGHVAELIAAGEVVERPASVVKELVENAVDAGASVVAVEIRRGGMELIRVSDNGCGIAPEELPVAFLRHATSKLRTCDDLGHIGTLGFRGEALAAISAVSRVEIRTRQRGADTGASLALEGGAAGEVREIGAPEGTVISVGNLFFNTPARLKFMRKDSAEAAAVGGLMQHLALSRPDISFRFRRDGTDALHTPGDGELLSAIYASLGREFAVTLIPASGRGGEIAVSGYVTKPSHGRGSRAMQVFFVNGRFIKSQLLTAAVEEAYRNQLLKGKFPGCCLSVAMPAAMVDVNVHPAKTQVKFAAERAVFDAVYHTVLDTLTERGGAVRHASAAVQTAGQAVGGQATGGKNGFFTAMDAATFRSDWLRHGREGGGAQADASPNVADEIDDGAQAEAAPDIVDGIDDSAQADASPNVADEIDSGAQAEAAPGAADGISDSTPEQPEQETLLPETGEPPWRIAGELLRTYIICESAGGDVYLIDKHAAHERMNFDRLLAAREPPMAQSLLTAAAVELSGEDSAAILENLPLLESLGFGAEDFGGGTVLLREIPAEVRPEDAVAVLEEIAENLRTGKSLEEKRESVLRTVACKAAIKGGWENDMAELRLLTDKVQSGEIRYCPHGRPVAVKISRYRLEKLFQRA